MHALPTPISSLRLVASGGRTADNIARTPLVQQLAERMHIEPLYYDDVARLPEHVRGLADIGGRRRRPASQRRSICSRAARAKCSLLASPEPQIERMLIYVEPSSFGRDSVLAAAASLARHLPIDVGMLVRDERGRRLSRSARSAQRLAAAARARHSHRDVPRHATEAVRERLVTSDEQTLLVIGLSAPERCSELVDDLQKLLREQPPAAVLFVSGRDQDASAVAAVRCGVLAVSASDAMHDAQLCCWRPSRCCRRAARAEAGRRAGELQLLNVSYDPTRELYREFNEHSSRSGSPTPARASRCRCRMAARAARRAPSSTASTPTS